MPVPRNVTVSVSPLTSPTTAWPPKSALPDTERSVVVRVGVMVRVLPTVNASIETKVPVAVFAPLTPSTTILTVCGRLVRPLTTRPTRNFLAAEKLLNVALRTPSTKTRALPWLGPVTVHQVSERPANVHDALAPARCSLTKLRPNEPVALVTGHARFTTALLSSSTVVARKALAVATDALPARSCTAAAAMATV